MSNQNYEESLKKREKVIIRTSFIGIIVNVLLAGLKALIGLFSNSIAVILDAVNNLSDALSSVITIIGAKLGAKAPNKKHPLGYGRVEYLSSMIVAALVIYAGITSLVESIKKIITPEVAEYNLTSIILLLVAIAAKIALGLYVKAQGKKNNSGALVASGTEAMMDAILSGAVVVSAGVYMIWHISLEAYVGVILSVIIIKAGIEMLIDTLNDILGKRADRDEVKKIKSIICEIPEVQGAYDLIMYNYGPQKDYASVHIELPDTMSVNDVDRISRQVQEVVFLKTGVILTGVGVYSHNTSSDEAAQIRNNIQKVVLNHEWALQLHGFYLDTKEKSIRFDLVVTFDIDHAEAIEIAKKDIKEIYPDYQLYIVTDFDF